MKLEELAIYKLAREISQEAWKVYDRFDWRDRKVIGDQWITAIDSVGANIAEGFGRFHYLDKNKFNYNARGSLLEAQHWTELLVERGKLSTSEADMMMDNIKKLHFQLNKYISATREQAR